MEKQEQLETLGNIISDLVAEATGTWKERAKEILDHVDHSDMQEFLSWFEDFLDQESN